MSMHAALIDVQGRKYVDVVGHGCFGSFDQKMVDGSSERSAAYKHPRLFPNRRDNADHRSGPSDDIICPPNLGYSLGTHTPS